MNNKKIILANWTHEKDIPGGMETRYGLLKNILPNSKLVSLYKYKEKTLDETYKELKKDDNILITDDLTYGEEGHPDIVQFGNPCNFLADTLNIDSFRNMSESRMKIKKDCIKIVNSNFMKLDIGQNGIEADIVIPACCDTNFFCEEFPKEKRKLKEKYCIPDNKRVGIFIGEVNQIKNFNMVHKLILKYKDIFWILVTKTMTEATNVLNNYKVYCGINKKQIKELLNCADFFILTSPCEGCSNAIFEAMSCNLPCIVSHTGYFYDWFDEEIGYRVKWNNFNEHCYAVEHINDRERKVRDIIFKEKLDFNSWKSKWEDVINEHFIN